jgi:hypothetical protein
MTDVITFPAVRACAELLLAGVVLQVAGVSAGKGLVIDWRTVRSGETLQADGDPFDTAQLFVALVGPEAAISVAGGVTPPPSSVVAPPEIHAWPPNEHGRRLREFTAPGGFRVQVRFESWMGGGDDGDTLAAEFTERLAQLAVEARS